MFKEERRHAIINLLIKDNSVSVSKLSDLYKVSTPARCIFLRGAPW